MRNFVVNFCLTGFCFSYSFKVLESDKSNKSRIFLDERWQQFEEYSINLIFNIGLYTRSKFKQFLCDDINKKKTKEKNNTLKQTKLIENKPKILWIFKYIIVLKKYILKINILNNHTHILKMACSFLWSQYIIFHKGKNKHKNWCAFALYICLYAVV